MSSKQTFYPEKRHHIPRFPIFHLLYIFFAKMFANYQKYHNFVTIPYILIAKDYAHDYSFQQLLVVA